MLAVGTVEVARLASANSEVARVMCGSWVATATAAKLLRVLLNYAL